MNTPDYLKSRVLQAAFCATSLFLMVPHAQAVDGYAKDASNGCAIFKPNLKSGETVAFKGSCANMFGEGRGVAKWSANDGTTVTFEGIFVQGKLQGNGKMTASGGDRYEGDYKDGKREGFGVYTSTNGDRFNGQYNDNQRNGHGILTLANGSVTEGEWRNGNPVSVTTRSSLGAEFAGPKLGPPQPSAAVPQTPQPQAPTAPSSETLGRQTPVRSTSSTRAESSSTTNTSAGKIGVETFAASGAILRTDRCGSRPLALGVDLTTSVVIVKMPKSVDLLNTIKSGNYNVSPIAGGIFTILREALDIAEKQCQVKNNLVGLTTDVYMYITQLPPPETKWPNTVDSYEQVHPKPSLIATWAKGRWDVKNLVSDAYLKEQQAKQQAQQTEREEQQAKQQEQLRQSQLTAIAEAKKKESDQEKTRTNRLEEFFKKHNLVDKNSKGLAANPFAFEGERLFLVVRFEQMQSVTTGLFFSNEGVLIVTDIPKGTFVTKEDKVLLAVKVLGNVRFDGVVGGLLPVNGMVPNLKYLGAIVCRNQPCFEMIEK